MMINIWIKHMILNHCIEVMFDRLYSNFQTPIEMESLPVEVIDLYRNTVLRAQSQYDAMVEYPNANPADIEYFYRKLALARNEFVLKTQQYLSRRVSI